MRPFLALLLAAAVAGVAAGAADARWSPPLGVPWQWQLDGRLKLSVHAPVYDVDGFETSAHEVKRLRRLGRHVVCY